MARYAPGFVERQQSRTLIVDDGLEFGGLESAPSELLVDDLASRIGQPLLGQSRLKCLL